MKRFTFFHLNLLAAAVFFVVLAIAVTTADGAGKPPGLVICRVFGSTCAKAVEVSYCESGMRADAVSRTRDVGLFQVNYAAHHKRGEAFAAFKRRMSDPERNAAFAYRLSRGGRDWSPWRWSRHCWGRS